jgi:hypothetical protein
MSEYKLVPKDGAETNKSEGFSGVATATYPIKGESGLGDTYEGNFLNGLKHYSPDDAKSLGPATYTYYNGTEEKVQVYEGYYVDNLKSSLWIGEGDNLRPMYPCKVTYFGPPKGEGGDTTAGFYHGYMMAGKRHGEGTMKYANGDVYSGMWKEGKKHGKGTYVFNTTKYKFVGDHWEMGKIQTGRWVLTNGVTFTGVFEMNKPVGDGTWTMVSKDIVSGTYDRSIVPTKAPDGTLGTAAELTWTTAGCEKAP